MPVPVPGSNAPDLKIETAVHGPFDLAQQVPPGGTLLAFYRGLHCPLCRAQLKELDDRIGDFAIRGVRLLALSGDGRERAVQLAEEMQIVRLPIGYGLDMRVARDDWGLLLSAAREGTEEPALFSEPGLFWVRQDGSLSFSVRHSLPFMRPTADQILKAMDFTLTNEFAPRGSYTGDLP